MRTDRTTATQSRPAAALRDPVTTMIRELDHATALTGYGKAVIFEDWLDVVESSLTQLPAHLAHMRTDGTLLLPAQEPANVQAIFTRLAARYGSKWPQISRRFGVAFGMLLHAASESYNDWLGSLFMEWELGNVYVGQFFTPFEISLMMTKLLNPAEMVYARLKTALLHPDNVWGHVVTLAGGMTTTTPEAEQYLVETVLPAALPYIVPITVYEPCVGSGSMLIAFAACVPSWATASGIVQYRGQDSDARCVQMARIQLMLYGMNGFGSQCVLAQMGSAPQTV